MTTLTQDPAGHYSLLIRYTCVIEGLRRIRDAHGAGPLAPLISYLIARVFVLLVRHAERLRPAQPADPAPARGDGARTPPRIRSTPRSCVGTVAAADRLIAALGTRDPEVAADPDVAPPTALAVAAVVERRFTPPARPFHTRNGARPRRRGSGLFAKNGIAAGGVVARQICYDLATM